jgi:HTH-type transcriptional regulator, glycine betaine synthesis regulator
LNHVNTAERRWETLALEGVGRVIEFWGFKRNHGRVWALLYLDGQPLDSAEIGRRLELSKGAVSMVTRELESWAVIRPAAVPGRGGLAYLAEVSLWKMIETVLERRELLLVGQVCDDLTRAEELVQSDRSLAPAERARLAARIRKLRRFGDGMRAALQAFLRSRQLSIAPLLGILAGRKESQ